MGERYVIQTDVCALATLPVSFTLALVGTDRVSGVAARSDALDTR